MLHHLLSIEDNLSRDMKIITCTDSEEAPSDEMSVTSEELCDETPLNSATRSLVYWYDEAIRMDLKEVLCRYHYSFEFVNKV
uniref:Uncharacterized protein n=1 Tax=Rhizophagus irregularis (strain DAOM 181602 / DAOM 197198 / MUCL 43194) TaxID=747089 RepID=U9TFQ1_RHIID